LEDHSDVFSDVFSSSDVRRIPPVEFLLPHKPPAPDAPPPPPDFFLIPPKPKAGLFWFLSPFSFEEGTCLDLLFGSPVLSFFPLRGPSGPAMAFQSQNVSCSLSAGYIPPPFSPFPNLPWRAVPPPTCSVYTATDFPRVQAADRARFHFGIFHERTRTESPFVPFQIERALLARPTITIFQQPKCFGARSSRRFGRSVDLPPFLTALYFFL